VLVDGTAGDDAIAVRGAGTTADVSGLPAADLLRLSGGGGADALDQSGLSPGVIGLEFAD
jgi:hypothetical protein